MISEATAAPLPIAIVLPPREGFSPTRFGAVSLTVQEQTSHSRYRPVTTVYGLVDAPPFADISYHIPKRSKRWHETGTHAYHRALLTAWEQNPPALVEVHNRPLLLRMLAKQRDKLPLALYLHNDPQTMKGYASVKSRAALLDQCDAVYCISAYVRSRLLEGLSHDDPRVHIIHAGVACEGKRIPKKKEILFVGRMIAEKGVVELAEALALVLPQHNDWRATIIGAQRHAVSKKPGKVETRVAELLAPLGEQVSILGFQSAEVVEQHTANAAIAVIPSTWQEPFGRTALEAMAKGCAVLTSGSGGLREIVGSAASIVHPVTAPGIATTLDYLIRRDNHRLALQDAALTRAAQFSHRAVAERLDAVRDRLLQPGIHHKVSA